MKTAVIIPTIREDCFKAFYEAWHPLLEGREVYVIEDNPTKSFDIDSSLKHFAHDDIDEILGHRSWIIPRKTDCVRSFGYWMAWKEGADILITLDDDCLPADDQYFKQHESALTSPTKEAAWTSTIDGIIPRGVPYFDTARENQTYLNHGLWDNVLDFDAVTQLTQHRCPQYWEYFKGPIPRGQFFPMCGMNLAWRKELTPAMYFLLMGKGFTYDRFGDIWCGLFVKKICDHLGYGVKSGDPLVNHLRASNVWANLKKEQPGLQINESLWQLIDKCTLSKTNVSDCYLELAEVLPNDDYFSQLRVAIHEWTGLFKTK